MNIIMQLIQKTRIFAALKAPDHSPSEVFYEFAEELSRVLHHRHSALRIRTVMGE